MPHRHENSFLLPLPLGEGWGEGLTRVTHTDLFVLEFQFTKHDKEKPATPSQALIPNPSPKGRRENDLKFQ